MIRKMTKKVRIGFVNIGAGYEIVIQSMTKVPTTDIGRCTRQVNKLIQAGYKLVRIVIPRRA